MVLRAIKKTSLPSESGMELLADRGDGCKLAHFGSGGSSLEDVLLVGGRGEPLCGVKGVRQPCQASWSYHTSEALHRPIYIRHENFCWRLTIDEG